MELQQLRYFDEVARTQHVTNSAKKLNVAQPALTQSIRRLERELGVTLFERVGRNVRLPARQMNGSSARSDSGRGSCEARSAGTAMPMRSKKRRARGSALSARTVRTRRSQRREEASCVTTKRASGCAKR